MTEAPPIRVRPSEDGGRALLPLLERLYLDTLRQTEDAREGIAAFPGKRLPKRTDR